MASRYLSVLQTLPKGYSLAFAYGSGVFKQLGHRNVKENMMDFILAVRDPQEWHQHNLALNPRHYSALRLGGPHLLASTQNWGAKVYFNTLIPTHEGMIKYGVISHSSLIADLLDWDTLYVAGRLHKPVQMLHQDSSDDELLSALKINLFSALHTALLLLPESFSEEHLYLTMTGLSYLGDFRMQVGEDQHKVRNIVRAQVQEFRSLYTPVLKDLEEYVILDPLRGMGEQDTSPPARLYHLSMLPKKLQLMLMKEWNRDRRNRDLEDVLRAAAHDTDTDDVIARGIEDIVKMSSLTQSVKGILTAGAIKSIRYSWSKLKKMWKSLRR